jgi:hypothetical protein
MHLMSRKAQAQTFGNLETKLVRTYQGQMDTLASEWRGGEQILWHIHVSNRGADAVVTKKFLNKGVRK